MLKRGRISATARSFIGLILLPGFFLAGASSLWAESETKSIHVSFVVQPQFDVVISSGAALPAVRFGPVSPQEGPMEQSVQIEIHTNKRQRYFIYQEMKSPLAHPEGEIFPKEELEFMVLPGKKGGQSNVPNRKPLSPGRELIFSSSNEGGPDSFTIVYTLKNKAIFNSGDYFGSVGLSVRSEG